MTMHIFGKLAGALALTAGLAGCIDAKVEVEVTSDTTAKATITQVMGAEIYQMVKASAADESAEASAADDFCSEGELTEGSDGSATCVLTREGTFEEIAKDEETGETAFSFTSPGPGLVRVAFPTSEITKDLGTQEEMDEQTKAMMASMFEGRAFTLKISGGEITDTNMTLAADKLSAEKVIPFLDIINGTVELPEELYAVVKK